jgi:tetratricopeptide (TPR) repeat protein
MGKSYQKISEKLKELLALAEDLVAESSSAYDDKDLSMLEHAANVYAAVAKTDLISAEDEDSVLQREAELRNKLGDIYIAKGQNDQRAYYYAITAYGKVTQISDRQSAVARNNCGVAYAKLGDFTEAISNFNQAIKIDPSFAKAYKNRGDAYDSIDDHQMAIADHKRAFELDSSLYRRSQ